MRISTLIPKPRLSRLLLSIQDNCQEQVPKSRQVGHPKGLAREAQVQGFNRVWHKFQRGLAKRCSGLQTYDLLGRQQQHPSNSPSAELLTAK